MGDSKRWAFQRQRRISALHPSKSRVGQPSLSLEIRRHLRRLHTRAEEVEEDKNGQTIHKFEVFPYLVQVNKEKVD